ncbi:MAG: flavin reductase family protein [Acidobacteriota bacterium]|jgi:flavin reductase (DIM6/NTAB) family NADH-FMN oxidoreductase RutF|nr:flavin reductase family protein [Acidobacteriota bacterium]
MPISKDEFRSALSKFASGVTVVTLKDKDGTPHGITVSAFSSVSLEPPLVSVCIDNDAGSHYAFRESERFVVNILSDKQSEHSNQFASRVPDKFINIHHHKGLEDIPVLKDALVNLECRLVNDFVVGDHTIFIGEIERTHINDGKPLVYYQGNYKKIEY